MSDVQFEEEGNTIGARSIYSNNVVPTIPKLVQLMIDWKLAQDEDKANKLLLIIAGISLVLTIGVVKVFIFPTTRELSPQEKAQLPQQILKQFGPIHN